MGLRSGANRLFDLDFTFTSHETTMAERIKYLPPDREVDGSIPDRYTLFSRFDSLPIFTRSPQKVGPKRGTK